MLFKEAGASAYRGFGLYDQGKYQEALECFNQALNVRPHHERALFYRGLIYFAQENFQAALKDFDRILTIDPYHQDAPTWKAKTEEYLNSGKTQQVTYSNYSS